MPTITLNTANPMLLHSGGQKPVTIANQDPTFPIIVGPELGIYAAQAEAGGGAYTDPRITVIPPGNSYTFDGTDTLYGLATNGAPQVNIAYNTYGIQTSLAGTNFVSPSTLIGTGVQQVFKITGGNNLVIPPAMLNQPGYELQVQLGINAASTEPFLDMFMMWSDSVSGLVVATEEWVLAAGPNVNNNIYMIKGPTKGNELSLNLVNIDPSLTMTVTITIAVNSRGWARDRIYTLAFNNPPGFTSAAGRGFTNVIATMDNLTITPGNNIQRILPIYAGDVWVWADQQGNAAGNSNLTLSVLPSSIFGSGNIYGVSPSGGPPSGVGIVKRFPRGHILMTYANTGSVNSTVNVKVVALDERN